MFAKMTIARDEIFHGAITNRSTVNVWECDQMGHLNVQFYGARFADAELQLFARLGLNGSAPPAGFALRPQREQIDFKRELRAGAGAVITSTPVACDRQCLRVTHVMRRADDDGVAATLDASYQLWDRTVGAPAPWPERLVAGVEGGSRDAAAAAAPVAAARVLQPRPTLADAERLRLTESYRGVVRASDCEDSGELGRRSLISRMSDAAGHIGIGDAREAERLRGRAIGSAALVYRIERYRPVLPGAAIALRSGPSGMTEKTIRFFHWLVNLDAGEIAIGMEVIAVYFDLSLRKAAPLPDHVRTALTGALIDWPPGAAP